MRKSCTETNPYVAVTESNHKPHYRKRTAILVAQALSYTLMITFIFADAQMELIGIFSVSNPSSAFSSPSSVACLIGIVGCINAWLTLFYFQKANSMRDMLVICAWTHRVKSNGNWMSLEQFFTQQLGYVVSHGLCSKKLLELQEEADRDWRRVKLDDARRKAEQDDGLEEKEPSFGYNSLQANPKKAPHRSGSLAASAPAHGVEDAACQPQAN